MKRFLTMGGLLCAVALLSLSPGRASAQMDFSLDESDTPAEEGGDAGGDTGGGDDGGGMSFTEEDAVAEGGDDTGDMGGGDDGGADFGGGEGDIIGELAAEGPEIDTTRDEAPRQDESVEEIYAVQQIYALRLNRVELAPSYSNTMNDPFISHPALSVALNYWWTNVLAIGVSFNWFQWGPPQQRESELNFFVRRATRLGIPVNEWQLGAYLNFTYVPFYGKFSVFNEFIFQWDAYVVGGVGMMRTRPIPVIDPEIREFDFQNRIAFNLGLGVRIFLSRFAGIFAEFRDYAYLEQFENTEVSALQSDAPGGRSDPETWFADSVSFSNNMTIQIGFTLFFPFTVDYELPK